MKRPKLKQITIIPKRAAYPKTSWWTGRAEDFYDRAKLEGQRMTQQTLPRAVQQYVDEQHELRGKP